MLAAIKPTDHTLPPSGPIASSSAFTFDGTPPPSYAEDLLHTPEEHLLPAYASHASFEPWLSLLRQPNWESNSDLALFLPPSPPKGAPTATAGWKAEYAEHVRQCLETGLHLDPCDDVQYDFMFDAIVDDVRHHVRTQIPPELRCKLLLLLIHAMRTDLIIYPRTGAALSFACCSRTPEPLALNPLFLDALHAESSQTPSPSARPTRPSPHVQWMLADLPTHNYALHLLAHTYLPQADLDALIKALFVLCCRERFRRAAKRRLMARENSLFRRLFGSGGSKWKKGSPKPKATQ
ncbi:hypothetical protein PUNSTDRAFT_133897 [Punctularia strigosozonata HHB-11173 SS5]|uniref:uncharacterized protein n=1 Tax=Punctularia strigosozonata (strain HHB-11173) TaxID=741275 RepID=UPI0004416A60|nr:uncharacterized protein PUNSTDRAFT_133897 [Punctularia strigosozonata HHB-11173 SS5]EIN08711.1 hypothetical protein PUNSTDRAFT_133897 [Punctularia strigosozonata HHB-11173 SS5]